MKIALMVAARTDARKQARELRRKGWTYDQIAEEVGCAKSSVSLWARDLPRPARDVAAHMDHMRSVRLRSLAEAEKEHRDALATARTTAQALSDEQLRTAGVALYWAEGMKDKGHPGRRAIQFTNSDPDVILVFLRWLELNDVARDRWRLHVAIHETADAARAKAFWAELTGVPAEDFNRTTVKRHNPLTNRRNTGDNYRGCLVVYVTKSNDLYRRMERAWYGIVGGAQRRVVEMPDSPPMQSPVV
ncbi:hypothetical protein [Streptomyces sp. NEAU-H3]|uniref:terminase gpP N-terminus-related DNA-binding protein n=1 Tax=Streptomyces sp. NEAU-H3 TaxID=2720636 RepID=UPI00143AC943|nr:hypothetical protein [Streptomyces sp. NEAU-H3]NJA55433.1 hypothetical protein [Streptomyces sp. NEAU-H3]